MDEDEASEPKKDSRLQLAKFNLEMKPLYEILASVESIRLATYLLEPEPVEIEALLGKNGSDKRREVLSRNAQQGNGDKWSGDASRNAGGFRAESQHVEISIGDDNGVGDKNKPKVCF